MKKCAYCKKETKNPKYCNRICSAKGKTRNIKTFSCLNCKQTFTRDGYTQRYYCSSKCMGKHQSTLHKESRVCAICKSSFLIRKSNKNILCSKKCLDISRSIRVKGDKNPSKRLDVRKKISKSSKLKFKNGTINPMKGKKRPDLTAYNKKTKHLQTKEKNGAWKGGLSFQYHGLDFTIALKRQIRKRDSYQCQVCTIHEKELAKKLNVHHIDYKKHNSIPKNLISVCKSCHGKTNFNRKHWKQFFKSKMRDIL